MVKFKKADPNQADFTVTINLVGGDVHQFLMDDGEISVPATTDVNKTLVKFLRRNPRLKEV